MQVLSKGQIPTFYFPKNRALSPLKYTAFEEQVNTIVSRHGGRELSVPALKEFITSVSSYHLPDPDGIILPIITFRMCTPEVSSGCYDVLRGRKVLFHELCVRVIPLSAPLELLPAGNHGLAPLKCPRMCRLWVCRECWHILCMSSFWRRVPLASAKRTCSAGSGKIT